METSLHRDLKYHFAASPEQVEVSVDGFRIDAIDSRGGLVEIQHAGIGAIKSKVHRLLEAGHRVRVIKPLVERKWVETWDENQLELLRRRKSPKRARPIDVFRELIHFTGVFPHARLTLEILAVDVVERRVDRVRRRWRSKQYKSLDQQLIAVGDTILLSKVGHLWELIGNPELPDPFCSRDLATAIDQPQWFAQQIVYSLHKCGGAKVCGKRGNFILYQRAKTRGRRAA